MRSAIAIVGPNGVGKTAVAYGLARQVGGEVVNLDKIYLFKRFNIATGLADTLAQGTDIPRHLYELLEPEEPIIPVAQFSALLRGVCSEIHARGAVPIIEGGSTTYFPGLVEANKAEPFCLAICALRSASPHREVIRQRVEAAFAAGLINEVERGRREHPNSLIVQDADFIVPLLPHLDGDYDLETAKERIVDRCLAYSERQLHMLEAADGVEWIEHSRATPETTIRAILSLLHG